MLYMLSIYFYFYLTFFFIIMKIIGLARGFAFVKFISIEHARQFIDTYFPYIDVEGTKVKIDYSTSTSHEDEDWNCSQVHIIIIKGNFIR